jgi:hypothetical protein
VSSTSLQLQPPPDRLRERKRINTHLLGGPQCARVAGDIPVDDAPAVVGEDEEDVEDAKGRGGHGQEFDGRHGAQVIVEESTPGLRGRLAWPGRHEARDAALSDVDAELEQLPVDPSRALAHVGLGHLLDERFDLGRDGVLSAYGNETSSARKGEIKCGASGRRCQA